MDGARFLLETSEPHCPGELHRIAVTVHNVSNRRIAVRFGVTFVSVGGQREVGQPSGGQIAAGWQGSVPLSYWSPFGQRAGVEPDPSLLLKEVLLTNVTVCPVDQPAASGAVPRVPCPERNVVLRSAPRCADAGLGDPRYGYTPLMIAARDGDAARVWQLVVCGADVNARASDGYTALMFAAVSGVVESADALLRGGASVNARQDNGYTALGLLGDQAPAMASLLRRHGAVR